MSKFLFFVVADSLRFTSAISFALAFLFIVVLIGITLYKLIDGSIKTPKLFPSVDDTSYLFNLFTAIPVLVCSYLCHYNGMKTNLLVNTTYHVCMFVPFKFTSVLLPFII